MALEAVALAVFAIAGLAAFSPDRPSAAIGAPLLLTLAAAGLGFAAWGLVRCHPRSRAPVIVVQAFLLLIASGLREPGTAESLHTIAPVLMIVAITVIVLVLSGPARRAMSSV